MMGAVFANYTSKINKKWIRRNFSDNVFPIVFVFWINVLFGWKYLIELINFDGLPLLILLFS